MTDAFLKGRVAVITGASRGIGAAVAKLFAVQGAKCVLVARTVGGLEEVDDDIRKAGGETPLLVPQDITKLKDLETLGPRLAEHFGRVDILVGNAGMLGTLSPVAQSNTDMWENCYRLNVLANQVLIKSLDPLLRGSDQGRAIFVSSAAAHKNLPHWGAYAASKAALEKMVLAYAEEVKHSPLKVNLVDPGPTRTNMRAEAMPGEDPMTLKTPDDIAPVFLDLVRPDLDLSGQIVKAAA